MQKKRVLVTGSSRGIGRATALKLAKDGWDVAVHFMQRRSEADETMKLMGEHATGSYEADLGDVKQAKALVARVLKDGPLHAVVNNAGTYINLDYVGSTEPVFNTAMQRCMTVNFESPALIIREACKHFMSQGGGKVVNVCSRVGHRGEAHAAFYSASKAALLNLTRALAVEHSKENIYHYAIAPGWVDTAMAREGMGNRLQEILDSIPLGRMATPEDCAGSIAFLLSQEADYLSGITVDINGASYIR